MSISKEERDKSIAIAAKDYAAGYLLMSKAMSYIETGDAELERIGLFHREVKMLASKTQRDFDAFNREFRKFLPKDGGGGVVLRDYDAISEEIERIVEERL